MSRDPVDPRETEWQFDAVDLNSVRRTLSDWPQGSGPVRVTEDGIVTQTDRYLDTSDHRLHRAGLTLRIRTFGRRRAGEATLKSLGGLVSAERGLRDRMEISQDLAPATTDTLLAADGPVSERLRLVVGQKPLLPLFTVRTRRHSFSLASGERRAGTLSLDETTIGSVNGSDRTPLRRVEVELDTAALETVRPFIDELVTAYGLQPAKLSKYETGLLVADAKPAEIELGSLTIDPADSIGSVARAVLRRQFSAFLAHEPGTRLGEDIEELHDMRVASRRIRAALALFKDVLPARISSLHGELRWIGGVLGDVRDLDVQLERLATWLELVPDPDRSALEALRECLDEERATAREAMLAALDSRRFELLVKRFSQALRPGPSRAPGPWAEPALVAAPSLVDARLQALRKAGTRIGPESDAGDYHRLRIRAKRFRYALEFVGDVYPRENRALIKRVVALQDVLGLHQDAEVAIARLRSLATDPQRPFDAATVFAMGEIAERYHQSIAALRSQVPSASKKVTGKSWRSFKKAMGDKRTAAEAEPEASDDPVEVPSAR